MGRNGEFEDGVEAGGEFAGDSKPGNGAVSSSPSQSSQLPVDGNWQVTERLLQTLNQELGEIKEYVLTELRGEIATLRSEKVQLQSQVQALQHQQDELLSDRQQAQQQQWAQQFAQVMTQNLRQQLQTQVFGLSESGGTVRPEQRLLVLHQQMVSLEEGLGAAIQMLQQELEQHQSELSQQLLRMQDLEQQGEVLLGALVQKLQAQQLSGAPQGQSTGAVAQSQPLTEGRLDSIQLPTESGNQSFGSMPMGQNSAGLSAGDLSGDMAGLEWNEPGLSEAGASGEAAMPNPEVAPGPGVRLPGHPTDVASVMAAMSNLKQPSAEEGSAGNPVTAESLAESLSGDAIDEDSAPSGTEAKQSPPR